MTLGIIMVLNISFQSQDSWIEFACKSIEHGIACIEMPLLPR